MRAAGTARRYAIGAAAVAAVVLPVSPLLSLLAAALGGFVLWFLRDPDRRPPASGIVAPADGRISVLREEGHRVRVGVYMGVSDVHVNRAPLGGTVESVEREPGAHRPAFSKESDRNERVRIAFEGYEVVLIAGAFARRITPYVAGGEAVARGGRIGHVAFGSRADVLLPAGVGRGDLLVARGDRVRAGETVVAREP